VHVTLHCICKAASKIKLLFDRQFETLGKSSSAAYFFLLNQFFFGSAKKVEEDEKKEREKSVPTCLLSFTFHAKHPAINLAFFCHITQPSATKAAAITSANIPLHFSLPLPRTILPFSHDHMLPTYINPSLSLYLQF
jgi:hypothetical protein